MTRKVADLQEYISELERKIHKVQRRIAAYPQAKQNFERYDTVFFSLGRSFPESFGKPLSGSSMHNLVVGAVSRASLVLLGKEYRLNPHGFRHIAALHVRSNNGNKEALASVMGQAVQMGDQYAAQIVDKVSQSKQADQWWH